MQPICLCVIVPSVTTIASFTFRQMLNVKYSCELCRCCKLSFAEGFASLCLILWHFAPRWKCHQWAMHFRCIFSFISWDGCCLSCGLLSAAPEMNTACAAIVWLLSLRQNSSGGERLRWGAQEAFFLHLLQCFNRAFCSMLCHCSESSGMEHRERCSAWQCVMISMPKIPAIRI